MKKILWILPILCLLCGCEMQMSEEQKEYQAGVRQLEEKKVKLIDNGKINEIEVLM